MRRNLVASILGLALSLAAVSESHADFYILFDTYAPSGLYQGDPGYPWCPVEWAFDQQAVSDSANVKADLLWQLGTRSGDAGLALPTRTYDNGPGWITGPSVDIPGNYSGEPVIFTIIAWVGSTYSTSPIRGSLTWTEPGFPDSGPWGFQAIPGPILIGIPEPASFAFLVLSGATVLMARSRK